MYRTDSRTSSSPPVTLTSAPPQRGHTASWSALSLAVPQSWQVTVAGTVMTSTVAPSASVPTATSSNACAMEAGSTACLTPQRTRIPATGRPAARVWTASSTPSQSPNSCTSPPLHLPDFQVTLDVRQRIDHYDQNRHDYHHRDYPAQHLAHFPSAV